MNFALITNKVVCQRLSEAKRKASVTKAKLEQFQLLDILLDWLIFSGTAVPKLTRSDRPHDAPRLLHEMLLALMGFRLGPNQIVRLIATVEKSECVSSTVSMVQTGTIFFAAKPGSAEQASSFGKG